MPRNKALAYAEDHLGVHEVWESTQESLATLDTLLAELDNAQDQRRRLDDAYADREVDLVHEMRGVHPSMSDTRFKSEYKGWERTDDALKGLRVQLNDVRSTIQGLEYDVDLCRLRIRAGSSRMDELGGYFHYLAVVKAQAETTTKSQQREDDT